MPRRRFTLSLIIAWTLAGCAHFSDIREFPDTFKHRLAKRTAWLTVTSFDNPRGVFPPAETSVVKRWDAKKAPSGGLVLEEVASSSFLGLMDAVRRGKEPRRRVDLRRSVDLTAFFPYRGHALGRRKRWVSDTYEFRPIDDERFEIRINRVGRVVFLPAPADSFKATNTPGTRDVGIWATPFGAEGELVTHLGTLIYSGEKQDLPAELTAGTYLHHDVSGRTSLPVTIDPSFPKELRPAVKAAAAKWNEALGVRLFRVNEAKAPVEPADCLSGLKLCIRWLGATKIVMTGSNGYTELAFDPKSGRIVGGLISVINDDVKAPFKTLSPEDLKGFKSKNLEWIADAMHRSVEMNDVLHPEPMGYVEYLIMHEMGHFNGLGHNFLTTADTTPARPVSSIMSYPPFPVAHRARYFAAGDLERLGIIYRGKTPRKELPYCSTFVTMAPDQGADGLYKKPAVCDMFTLGDTAAWYILLARRSKRGVFAQFPDMSHLSEELQTLYREMAAKRGLPPFNVLTRLGYILADPGPENSDRRASVTAFLCEFAGERPAIAAQLKTFHGVGLDCSKLPPEVRS